MPTILAFETSSPILSVALQKGRAQIREICVEGFLSHAENLLPSIDTLLKKEKIKLDAVDTLLIGRGPGSFTGLRIGFASLKGLIVVQKRRCYGALSLDVIAEGVQLPEGSELTVCLDARREKIHVKRFRRTPLGWASTSEAQVLNFEETLRALPSEGYLTGDALTKYGSRFKEEAGKKVMHFLDESAWYPKAFNLITLFQKSRGSKTDSSVQPLTNPTDFLPLYFRLSEAEEKKKEHVRVS